MVWFALALVIMVLINIEVLFRLFPGKTRDVWLSLQSKMEIICQTNTDARKDKTRLYEQVTDDISVKFPGLPVIKS